MNSRLIDTLITLNLSSSRSYFHSGVNFTKDEAVIALLELLCKAKMLKVLDISRQNVSHNYGSNGVRGI